MCVFEKLRDWLAMLVLGWCRYEYREASTNIYKHSTWSFQFGCALTYACFTVSFGDTYPSRRVVFTLVRLDIQYQERSDRNVKCSANTTDSQK
jgi:hypothetical protein